MICFLVLFWDVVKMKLFFLLRCVSVIGDVKRMKGVFIESRIGNCSVIIKTNGE